MKKIHYLTIILVVLLILAIVSGWEIVWKIVVGTYAVYILAMITFKFWKDKK